MMKKIERGTTKHLMVLVSAVVIFGLLLYPLFDYIICRSIENSNFEYSINQHIIQPILLAFVYGIVFWSAYKKNN